MPAAEPTTEREAMSIRNLIRTITVGEVALAVIAVFVVLAYFNGWG